MRYEWHTKFKTALLERDPVLQSLRIAEAFEAIIHRMEELDQIGHGSNSESHRLKYALDELKHLRDLNLERPA
jgi:hypothetical protein